MKRLLSAIFAVLFVAGSLLVNGIAAEAEGKNLTAAKKAYDTDKVIVNESLDSLQSDLFEAALNNSSDNSPCIVYIPAKTTYVVKTAKAYKKGGIEAGYTVGLYVPENVVLVGEASTVIKAGKEMKRLVMVSGSVYGGKFDGASKVSFPLSFKNGTTFEKTKSGTRQVDGNIEYVDACGATSCCIKAISCKNIRICNNNIHDSKTRNTCGISIMYGSLATSISKNTITNIGSEKYGSGIDITHASADNVNNNTISKTGGHGISTDTEQSPASKTKQSYVRITNMKGNKISKAGAHGIWLEKRCYVTGSFSSNTITSSGSCGIAVQGTHKYPGDNKYVIKSMTSNTIKSSKRSNISLTGKYGLMRLGKNNIVSDSVEQSSIVVDENAKLYIVGTGNKIKGSAQYGIYLKNGAYLKSTYKKTYIQENGKYAIGLASGSKAELKYATLTNNTNGSAYVGSGCTLKLTSCKTNKVVRA